MTDGNELAWADVEDGAAKIFKVWVTGSELKWAEEAWTFLAEKGLASCATEIEVTASYLRLVALAQIYEEFCGAAWEENPETPLNYFAEHFEINPLALGVLAAEIDSTELHGAAEDFELLEAALFIVTRNLRIEIFECLEAAYGGAHQLYLRLSRTRSPVPSPDEDDDALEVTGANSTAYEFVTNGFRL